MLFTCYLGFVCIADSNKLLKISFSKLRILNNLYGFSLSQNDTLRLLNDHLFIHTSSRIFTSISSFNFYGKDVKSKKYLRFDFEQSFTRSFEAFSESM